MKTFRTAAYGVIALASAGIASAQIKINFAASNGDRNATQTAIAKLLDNWTYRGTTGALVNQPKLTSGNVADIARNSNFGTWRGTYNGQTVVIRTNYAGALAGIAAVAGDTTPRFDSTDGLINGGTPGTAGDGPIPAGNNLLTTTNTDLYIEQQVDFGLSTNYQKTSPFNGLYNGIFYNQIAQEEVGISPLGFYASPGFPADNITSQIARQLYSAGSVPLSLFTGNNADANKIVFAIGRNTDAGQRYAAQLEIGHGPGAAFVWKPVVTDAQTGPVTGFTYGGTVNSHSQWGLETNSGITETGGFNGGATLAPALTVTLGPNAYKAKNSAGIYEFPDAQAGYYIGYLTPGMPMAAFSVSIRPERSSMAATRPTSG